jgi:cytochrome c
MRKTFIVLSVIIFAACSPKVYVPSDTDAIRGSEKFPGVTVAELNEGKALYEQKCTICHQAMKLTSKTEEQWRKIVPDMAARYEKSGKGVISMAEQDKILKYILVMGSK